jgi:hypothetical protein
MRQRRRPKLKCTNWVLNVTSEVHTQVIEEARRRGCRINEVVHAALKLFLARDKVERDALLDLRIEEGYCDKQVRD